MRSNPKLFIVAGVVFTLSAASGAYGSSAKTTNDGRTSTPVGTLYAQARADHDPEPIAADPDNSGRNVRDQGDKTLTPTDQSSAASDVEMTRKIRKAITSDDAMSMLARNVKIITQRGVVTLRGPVKTKGERATIESLAKSAGAVRIDNQLEIDGDMPSSEKE